MTVQATSSSVERELEYRKKLSAITNQLNSAESIPHILLTLKDKILELLDAERLTIYAVDTKNQELYSIQKIGDVPKEIRVPKSFASITGFTALARKTINIKDAYDSAELTKYHPNLRFDQRWDKQSGFRTKSVLAVPIVFEKYLLGVLQLINKRHGTIFTAQDEDGAEEIARMPSRRVRSCGSSTATTRTPGRRSTGAQVYFFHISEGTRSFRSAGMVCMPS